MEPCRVRALIASPPKLRGRSTPSPSYTRRGGTITKKTDIRVFIAFTISNLRFLSSIFRGLPISTNFYSGELARLYTRRQYETESFRHRVDHRRGRVAGTVVPEGQPSTSVPRRLGAINGRLAIRSSSNYGHPTPSCWCLLREIWSHSYVLNCTRSRIQRSRSPAADE